MIDNMIVYTARINTDSGETYVWVYRKRPTHNDVIKNFYECSGKDRDLEWYESTTKIFISQTQLL